MNGLNQVQLIGNLGADPEIRTLNNGGTVANLRVATSESWTNRDGDRQERTEWHTVVSFADALNEKVIEKYLFKGSRVFIQGKLQTRKWEDRDGNDRYSTEVVIDSFTGILTLLDRADDDRGGRDRDRGGSGRGKDRDDDRRGGRGRDRDDRRDSRDDDDRVTRGGRGGRGRSRDDDRDNDRRDDRERSGGRSRGRDRDDRRSFARDSRENEDIDRGRSDEPEPSAFDTELDDDVPF